MNPTLLEARERVETAILEAGQGQHRGGHRHWGVYGTRAAWEREKRLRAMEAEMDEGLIALKRQMEQELAELEQLGE